MPLTIVAHIQAKAGKTDLVKTKLFKLIARTRAEMGCIRYDLHQDTNDPAHFPFYENWDSHELWRTHMNARHLAAYRAATKGTVDKLHPA